MKKTIAFHFSLCYKMKPRDAFPEKERMENLSFNFLSGKYEILKPLGKGQYSTVYLARHLSLNRLCAVKVTPHLDSGADSLATEALLLQQLCHPGIPQIFDMEHNSSTTYLIEEYVEGPTLEEFLLLQQFISRELFFSFCQELCEIFTYLHSFSQFPILYQDLKPEHIIVCDFHLKIIDFGGIWNPTNSGKNYHQGNQEFSAPEVLQGHVPTVTSDVYCLGRLFQFMEKYLETPLSPITRNILAKATHPDVSLRIPNVAELKEQLFQIIDSGETHLSTAHRIAVLGSFPGCGTTHFAIALTSYLKKKGYQSIYLEENNSRTLLQLSEVYPGCKSKDGAICYKHFIGFPKYGTGIDLSIPDADFYIYDFGSIYNLQDLKNIDSIILMGSNAAWRMNHVLSKAESLLSFSQIKSNKGVKPVLLINQGSKNSVVKTLYKKTRLPVFFVPWISSPFYPEDSHLPFFDALCKKIFSKKESRT